MLEICEVGPRDGLQVAPVTLSPRRRAELISRLESAGLRRLEVASFVHPRLVPQMDGAEELVSLLPGAGRAVRTALVLNQRGYERARDAGLTDLRFVYAVSDYFNRRNAGVSAAEGRATAVELIERGAVDGIEVGLVLGTAFGCPFTGMVDPAAVEAGFAAGAEAGAAEIVFADTVGVGVPGQVRRFAALPAGQGVKFGFHFHDTRNTGYANAWEAVQRGAEVLDSTSAASAAARSPPTRAATSPPRTSPTCSSARGSRPASTSGS